MKVLSHLPFPLLPPKKILDFQEWALAFIFVPQKYPFLPSKCGCFPDLFIRNIAAYTLNPYTPEEIRVYSCN
jgi:hypothetical protein